MPGSRHRTNDPGDQLGNRAPSTELMQQNKLQLSNQTSLDLNPTLPSSLGGLGLVTPRVWDLTFLICKNNGNPSAYYKALLWEFIEIINIHLAQCY